MSRPRVKISELASSLGLTEENARGILEEAGIRPKGMRGLIPREKLNEARQLLAVRESQSPSASVQLSAAPRPSELSSSPQGRPQRSRRAEKRRASRIRDLVWKVTGSPEPVQHLSAADIERIHWCLVADFVKSRDPIDPPGVRDRSLLESAVFRPITSLGDTAKYPTVSMASAALFHALVHNHPFHNGNKRTALVSLVVLLDRHGYILQVDQDELYEYVLALADHRLVQDHPAAYSDYADREVLAVARWVQGRIRRVRKGEKPMKFRELKTILTKYGCEFEALPGNRLNIRRNGLYTQVGYGGDGREADPSTVHKIRKDLQLDEGHGYDSATFYEHQERIPDFIMKYRRTLERLARV